MTFASSIIRFFSELPTIEPEKGIEIINPYRKEEVMKYVNLFYSKYFSDSVPRTFIIGINPGRLGGGLTGISFTDPVALREHCGIENTLGNKTELSSRFIYSMIETMGGPQLFYAQFYLTALYPLAIIKDGKNFNYYDEKYLFELLKPFMVFSLSAQIKCGARRDVAVCLGKRNYGFVKKLNDEHGFFKELKVAEHPRYIMQYKLKNVSDYINQYREILGSSSD